MGLNQEIAPATEELRRFPGPNRRNSQISNPIENMWAIIKRKLASEFPTPKTRSELIANVTAIWNGLSPELCVKLSDSMINRL